ncbi:hypothetical protein C8R43DRAFT_969459 [Mycena crocata]|nr:hypothetical protein C8R43DRAFT_969459 [Mycena crocata]
MSVPSSPESRYPIPAVSPEKERLSKFYAMKKAVYGWANAVPHTIDLSWVERVIDVGAGTCIWIQDFAAMPEIQARRDEIHLYVCDINTAFFPEFINELGVTAFQQDVTKPFPQELQGTFDLVRASFLVGGLIPDGWKAALANYHTLLKPGGLVILDETDTLFLPSNFGQDPEVVEEDLTNNIAGNTWVHKANSVFMTYSSRQQYIIRITSSLRAMLENAGFNIEQSGIHAMPIGPPCRSRLGADGGSLAEYEKFSLQNVELVLAHLSAHMLKSGTLEIPKGNKIFGEVEMQTVLKQIEEGMRTEGVITQVGYFVARKY